MKALFHAVFVGALLVILVPYASWAATAPCGRPPSDRFGQLLATADFSANHRYNVGLEMLSVLQMSAMTMLLSAWSFFAV